MDILRKNVPWIALGGLAIGIYCYMQLSKKADKPADPTAEFGGKLNVTNPVK